MYCSRCGTQNEDTSKFCRSCGLDLAATPLKGEPEIAEIDMVRRELKGEYDILEELGRGGMAIVFKARERQLERDVAIKVLPFSLAFDKEFVERFEREARTSAKLEHPNIIPIYRVGKSGRVTYFVMKYLRGQPLSALLAERGALSPGEIRQVLAQVARALAYAHKSGIVHRDIKPDNIMFDEHGLAVVTDFGIAKAATGGKLTGTGMSIGTPHYMSPEQARAQGLDGRSDLYSLGVVAYQCLTGSVPYDGEDSFSIGYKHIMEEMPIPVLDTPDKWELFEVVRKMMAKSPEDRYQSAEELGKLLDGAGGFATVTLGSAPIRYMSSLPTTALPLSFDTPLPTARPRHSVSGSVLLWLLIVGTAVGGGFYAYKQGWLLASAAPDRPDTADLPSDTAYAVDSVDPSQVASFPPGTPGKLTLEGMPQGAKATLNGQLVTGTQFDVSPGVYTLVVQAPGYALLQRQVVITPGRSSVIKVEMLLAGTRAAGGPCAQYGPAYNQDHLCFDSRPVPLASTLLPVPHDAPVVPREAILLFHVSRTGETMAVRLFVRSNVETFNDQALDVAKGLRWNPAQKDGEPVDSWVQWPFKPVPSR